MKKIFFKGYYGHENLGDDIFVVVADWLGNYYFENIKPVFIGNKLPQISNNSIKYNINNDFIRRLFEFYLSLTADNILYFGGSLFTNGGENILDLKYLIRKMKFLQKKTNIFGVSIGPFKNNKDLLTTADLLKKLNFIGVRDEKSLKLLKKMKVNKNVNFTFDNAILLRTIYPGLIKKKLRRKDIKIGISLTRNQSHTGKNLTKELSRENSILETIDELININPNISELSFIVFNGNEENGDVESTKKVEKYFSSKIKTSIINYSSETEWMLQQITDCDFILGTRLHSGIIAYSFEIPFLLLEYHDKCTEFLDTINYKYRYLINNPQKNSYTINDIIENEDMESAISPQKFEDFILHKIKKMEEILTNGS